MRDFDFLGDVLGDSSVALSAESKDARRFSYTLRVVDDIGPILIPRARSSARSSESVSSDMRSIILESKF